MFQPEIHHPTSNTVHILHAGGSWEIARSSLFQHGALSACLAQQSANLLSGVSHNFGCEDTLVGRSLMWIRNSNGPSANPWGTPDSTLSLDEVSPSTTRLLSVSEEADYPCKDVSCDTSVSSFPVVSCVAQYRMLKQNWVPPHLPVHSSLIGLWSLAVWLGVGPHSCGKLWIHIGSCLSHHVCLDVVWCGLWRYASLFYNKCMLVTLVSIVFRLMCVGFLKIGVICIKWTIIWYIGG